MNNVIAQFKCGLGRFVLDDENVIYQYDDQDQVVGISRANKMPYIRRMFEPDPPKPNFHSEHANETKFQSKAPGKLTAE